MANSNGWGDGAANNTIGWGQGANNEIGWGKSHLLSYAGLTDIVGLISGDIAPFIITNPILSETSICATLGNYVYINNMVWGGTPTPTITYSWFQVNPLGVGLDIEIGQYTNTLQLSFALAESYLYCKITATNSAGVVEINTPQVYALDCT